jgi:outer membrane lipoprotein SlyB
MRRLPWIAFLMALLLAACASTPGASISGTGIVQSISEGTEASKTGRVVGAIGGAVLGGWLGSNIGGGVGQTVATAAGSVAGGVAGSAVGSQET